MRVFSSMLQNLWYMVYLYLQCNINVLIIMECSKFNMQSLTVFLLSTNYLFWISLSSKVSRRDCKYMEVWSVAQRWKIWCFSSAVLARLYFTVCTSAISLYRSTLIFIHFSACRKTVLVSAQKGKRDQINKPQGKTLIGQPQCLKAA